MKIILNNKEYKLFFKYSLQEVNYVIRNSYIKNQCRFTSSEYIIGEERVVECFVTTKDNKIFAKGNSKCYYKDKFVKERGRIQAIKNLSFGDLESWNDLTDVLKKSILQQYNNRKNGRIIL